MTSRRNFIYGIMAAPVVLRTRLGAAIANVGSNPIQLENDKPGTAAWQIGPPYQNSNDTDQWIRGYASATASTRAKRSP